MRGAVLLASALGAAASLAGAGEGGCRREGGCHPHADTSLMQLSSKRARLSQTSTEEELCDYLRKVVRERSAKENGTIILDDSPLHGRSLPCQQLPPRVRRAAQGEPANVTIRVADPSIAETQYAQLPRAGILVVSVGSNVDSEDLVWKAVYSIHSHEYFEAYTGMSADSLGFPDLEFATFLPGHVVLQKAKYSTDMVEADGEFGQLAKAAGTDKVFSDHNYTLLYHQYFDSFPKSQPGVMLEIGLGCTMDYGAGASAKIWPKLFPHLAVHFIELNRECTEKWLPKMKEVGVAGVYIGSQANTSVLQEVSRDAEASQGGLQIVVDDGSHECDHIETSFRELFPHVAPGGLYFVEDIMYSAWGTRLRQNITSKTQRTAGTPIALTAVLGSKVAGARTGARDAAPTVPLSLYETGRLSWAEGLTDSIGPLVDFVECTPGVCLFRRHRLNR